MGIPEATAICEALAGVPVDPHFPIYYVELGCAEGKTFAAVLHRLKALGRRCYGYAVDKAGGWSYTDGGLKQNLKEFTLGADYQYFLNGSVSFMGFCLPESIYVVLIDACHEKDCCRADFLAVEPKVKPGGLVIFHDTAVYAQGTDIQPHRGEPIRVREALEELQLLPPKGGTPTGYRHNWKLIAEVPGNQERDERGIVIVQKLPAVDRMGS